jgi:hypothetical protein
MRALAGAGGTMTAEKFAHPCRYDFRPDPCVDGPPVTYH